MKPKLTIGIPRVLNIYENFPFWCTMFVQLGMEVRISSPSNAEIYEKGAGTVMSDSICFPAKLVHGHIIDLIEKGVDRIFYPTVVYEQHEQKGFNSYNCPIVTGYPDVIRSSVNPEGKHGVPFDMPTFSFKDINLLRKSCLKYFRQLGVSRRRFSKAFNMALDAHVTFKRTLREKALDVVKTAATEGRKVIMLVGRPYHLDRFINHGVPEILSQMGMDVITCDSVPPSQNLDDVQVLTQWAYSNRLYNAGKFAYGQKNVEVVQLNSFGCGLDAISTDELSEILKGSGKNLTVLR
ncbi:MAG: CoA activase, partial [Deltaproteobacteria bacterium]|nr:CoA activase [Deltaproteobacteria bacterium]